MRSIRLISLLIAISLLGLNSHSVTKVEAQTKQLSIKKQTAIHRYEVRGDRKGKVTVIDTTSRKIIRTFQMDAGVVVRERFVLDGGKTIAASQKDHTVFWDLATGKEIGRVNERVRGFSPTQRQFFTESSRGIELYSYPNLSFVCNLTSDRGIESFQFSPDERFLGVRIETGYPEPDEQYPGNLNTRLSIVYTLLLNLRNCQEVKEFSRLNSRSYGEFSTDSQFMYLTGKFRINKHSSPMDGNWIFDLNNYTLKILD